MAKNSIDITVSKQRVMDEVAKTTAYIGSKAVSTEDPDAFERIATTDANREQLDRYWMEASTGASMLLDHWATLISSQVLTHHPELGNDYTATLGMPTNWPTQYTSALHEALTSYMVNMIVSKWLMLTMPSQAEGYAAMAAGAGVQVEQIMLMRARPVARKSVKPSGETEGEIWVGSNLWIGNNIWGQ